jgi:hypothetical protein
LVFFFGVCHCHHCHHYHLASLFCKISVKR